MKSTKTRIAAVATILGLGGLTGIALSAGGQKADPLAAKPLVRTKVIHRTVRVTKHLKPKHPVAAGGAGYASSTGSAYGESAPVTTAASGTGGGEPAPVTTATSGAGASEPAPVTTASSGTGGEATPVTTATSGAGGAGGGGEVEHESEGGADD